MADGGLVKHVLHDSRNRRITLQIKYLRCLIGDRRKLMQRWRKYIAENEPAVKQPTEIKVQVIPQVPTQDLTALPDAFPLTPDFVPED